MPSVYTGNPASISGRPDIEITNPLDGEAHTADSNNVGVEQLSDFMAYLMQKAGITDIASAWSALQTFNGGVAANINHATSSAAEGINAGAGPGGRFQSAGVKGCVVHAANEFGHAAAVVRTIILGAEQFQSNNPSAGLSLGSARSDWRSLSSASHVVSSNILIPKGARITGLKAWFENGDGVTRTAVCTIRHLTWQDSPSAPFNSVVAANVSQDVTTLDGGWYDLAMSDTSARAENSYTRINMTIPQTGTDFQFLFAGCHITYEHELLTPVF